MVDDMILWGSKGLNGCTFAYTRTKPSRVMCVYERDSSFFCSLLGSVEVGGSQKGIRSYNIITYSKLDAKNSILF